MRILMGGPYVYKDQRISGGVESVLHNLRQGIKLYEPDIILRIVSGSDKPRAKIEIDDDITYIKHPKMKIGSVFISSYPYRVKNFLRKSEFDVINYHSLDFPRYGYELRNKLLFTGHGIIQEEEKFLPKHQQPFYHRLYVKKFEKLLKYLKYFVSINPYSKELVKNKTKAVIFDIHNPIPDEIFELENKRQDNRMFYIGLISKRKNLFALIKALNIIRRKNKNFKLFIAGKIVNQGYFDEILNYVHKNKLNDFFEYLGNISEGRKLEELSKMSFLILPSLQETAPMVISESFAVGKPVIASDLCGIPHMIDDGKNGMLINPSDEKDISEKILYFMENPSVTTSMGKNGKRYALEHHSLKVVTKKYRAAFDEIISSS
jgi:glycosyltransferase involved in cell wall biosynthesis